MESARPRPTPADRPSEASGAEDVVGRDPSAPVRDIPSLHVNSEPTWRGGEQQMLYLLQGLERRGHSVWLCAQRGGVLEERAKAAGIHTTPLDMWADFAPRAILGLAAAIRRLRPAVVHVHTSHAHSIALLACKLVTRDRPRVLLTRRVDFSIYRHSFLGLNAWKYKRVDRIVTVSAEIKRVLVADGLDPERIDVVPSGIDPRRFSGIDACDLRSEFGLPPGTRIVANVAFFADHKGQRYLVEAAPRILREEPDTAIFLVGEGELRQSLMDLARSLGVADRVIFPGFRTDVPAILKAADVCVMSSWLEGLGTSILDALCCGVPVVGTRVGGIPEIIEDGVNGLLVPAREPEALAEAVIRLLRDPTERGRLGAAGRSTVMERFTAERMVDGNVAVYERLLEHRGAEH